MIFILMLVNILFSSFRFFFFSWNNFFHCSIFKITIIFIFINGVFTYKFLFFCISSSFFFFNLSRKNCFFTNFNSWLLKFCKIEIECSWFIWLSYDLSDMTSIFNSFLKGNRNRIKMKINFINEINRNTSNSRSKNWIVSIWINIFNCLSFECLLNCWDFFSWWLTS